MAAAGPDQDLRIFQDYPTAVHTHATEPAQRRVAVAMAFHKMRNAPAFITIMSFRLPHTLTSAHPATLKRYWHRSSDYPKPIALERLRLVPRQA